MSGLCGLRDMALGRSDIAKAFVNHRQGRRRNLRLECAGWVVGVNHDTGHRCGRLLLYVPAMKPKGGGMFIIAAQGNLGLTARLQCRNLRNGGGASRHGENIRLRGNPPKSPCGGTKRCICAIIRQGGPIIRSQIEAS